MTIVVDDFKCPGKGSVRVFRGRAYKDANTAVAMHTLGMVVKQQWGAREALTGPVSVSIRRTVPPTAKGKHTGEGWDTNKPDADNVAKLVLDCLSGVCFADDKQISRLVVVKMVGRPGCRAGLTIDVDQLHRDKIREGET